ncbi:MAG TPA: antibiotic biosynthesis monooxygenase [Opitutaceae bacterium]|jgi:quinol monooxygenase YgiN|nr:antibiotic biosynthesis monooxygenase [Opitutaceae bacterium]
MPYVVLVEWKVPSRHHAAFIEAVANLVQGNPQPYRGLLSATFHRSADGNRIINYARWKSRKAWESSFEAPGRAEATAAIQKVVRSYGAKSLGVEGFHVGRVVDCGRG